MGRQPTAFDMHRELVRTRNASEASNELLGGISESLSSIHVEMETVRKANQKSLAIQQEMLDRDIIQGRLEEFIYKADQMVTDFERPETDAIPSSRYFLLTGLLEAVQTEGISTAVVRGRDNKAALDQMLKRASLLVRSLADDEEVKEALAWAAEENKKRLALEEQARKQQALLEDAARRKELEAAREQRAGERRELKAKLAELNATGLKAKGFIEWYKGTFIADLPWYGQAAIAWVPPFCALILAWFFMSSAMQKVQVQERVRLEARLAALEAEDRAT